VLTFKTAPDYETKSSYSLTVTVSDGSNSDNQSLNINLSNVNEAPVISALSHLIAVAENETDVVSVSASDPENGTLTFTLSGTDASYFSISSTGVLTFKTAPDYETKSSYSLTVTVSDGSSTISQDITVIDEAQTTAFTGYSIDGYISGATVFIDQNFNFSKDAGEYSAITDSNGAFTINVSSTDVGCLVNRPIVADVPVGAEDSTLGTVSNAYQMILPSISDTGAGSIVITPFTSLFAEAILSAKSEIDEDLSVAEGCSSSGDNIATKISERIDSLKSSIQNNFGISFTDLTSDFIASSGEKVNETAAQNIAKILPYLRSIDDQVSTGLTSKFGKNIRANVSLSESALDIIFGGSSYEKLPLDFKSIYRTDPNSEGWYQDEVLTASGAYISDSGRLYRADCSETDTELCSITDLSLKNISNASTSFEQSSNFYKNDIDFADLGVNSGSLYVTARDSRAWRNNSANWQDKNNRDRECQSDNQIRFKNSAVAGTSTEFQYSSYSQGYQRADCDAVRHYYFPILETQTFIDNESTSIAISYYIVDINRSGITENPPYDFISNRVNIDPTIMVKDIASLPRTFKEINTIRRMLNVEDYALFKYGVGGDTCQSSSHSYFEAGTNPRNDMYWYICSDYDQERKYGQAARDAFFAALKAESTFSEDIYGSTAPTNDTVLGRIAKHRIEIVDYSGTDEIILPLYPTYDANTKTLDYSLIGSELNLENLQNFIENGIDGKPVAANIWYNPDDSISGNVPIVLYLYEGDDTTVDSGEGYFSIEFELTVSSSADNLEQAEIGQGAKQTWTVPENAVIKAKYVEDGVTISRDIANGSADSTILEDMGRDDAKIQGPSNLDLMILNLINSVSDKITGIKSFFQDNGTYTYKIDIGTGGHSIIDFDRNTVDFITGTIKTASSPSYAISVNDIRINEGSTEDLCFYRPSKGDLSAVTLGLSFTQRERPGKGALADDFTLSSSTVEFAENDTKVCIQVTAEDDTYFDWVHYAYLDISVITGSSNLSRNQVRISLLDSYGYQNRISWKEK